MWSLFVVCALVRKELHAGVVTADGADAAWLGEECDGACPTVEEVLIDADDLEVEDHVNKCEREDLIAGIRRHPQAWTVGLDSDAETAGESALQVEEQGGDAELVGTCTVDGKFTGAFESHLYNTTICKDKNVLYLYPEHDHNNAFGLNQNLCERLVQWYDAGCSVHVYKVGSISAAKTVVRKYAANSLMLAVLGGHGSWRTLRWGSNSECGQGKLCSHDPESRRFLEELSAKLQEHASVFLDSCLSASQDKGLSWWVSQWLRKGIRVMGSIKSFSNVYWGRFGAGNFVANVLVDGEKIAVKHYKTGGECPAFAKSREVNDDGECECAAGTHCTYAGGECPLVRGGQGGTSSVMFIPSCATIGDKRGQCECVRGDAPATVGFQVGDRVKCKDKADTKWRTGTVSSLNPLQVTPDGWDQGFKWDEIEPLDTIAARPLGLAAGFAVLPGAPLGATAGLAPRAFRVGETVRVRDNGRQWRTGVVTSVDGGVHVKPSSLVGSSGMLWDKVEHL